MSSVYGEEWECLMLRDYVGVRGGCLAVLTSRVEEYFCSATLTLVCLNKKLMISALVQYGPHVDELVWGPLSCKGAHYRGEAGWSAGSALAERD